MRPATACALALALAACGGGQKGASSGPGRSTGTVSYLDQGPPAPAAQPAPPPNMTPPGGGPAAPSAAAPGAGEAGGAAQPAAPAEPPPPPPPEIRPPGNDLAPEQRAAIVAERMRKAVAALASRDADTAIREARAALDADETAVPAMIALAHAYYLKQYDDKAEAVLLIAKKRPEGERNPTLWMLLGLIYDRAEGREDEALACYERAVQLKPDHAKALTNAGVIYIKRKRYADAVRAFEHVVQLRPQAARAHTGLGAAFRGMSAETALPQEQREEYLRKAEFQLKKALATDPTYAPADFDLGVLYLDADPFPGLDTLGRLKLAIQYLTEYKRAMGSGLKANDPVDQHIAAAEKARDREQKRQEARRKREERDRQKKAEEAAGAGGAGGDKPQPEGGTP